MGGSSLFPELMDGYSTVKNNPKKKVASYREIRISNPQSSINNILILIEYENRKPTSHKKLLSIELVCNTEQAGSHIRIPHSDFCALHTPVACVIVVILRVLTT